MMTLRQQAGSPGAVRTVCDAVWTLWKKARDARVALAINLLSLFALALGFGQQLLLVSLHGATALTDAYFLLIVFPQITINLSVNIVNNALLPWMVRVNAGDGASALAGLRRYVVRRLTVVSVVFGMIVLAGSWWQVEAMPTAVTHSREVWAMLVGCALLVVPGMVAGLYSTTLNSQHRYFATMGCMGLPPLAGITFGFLLRGYGIWPFLLGQVAGFTLQWMWLRKLVLAAEPDHGCIGSWKPESADRSLLMAKVGSLLVLGLGFQFVPMIERHFARGVGIGAVTVIAVGSRLGNMLSPALAAGASTILFTHMSEQAARGETRQAARRLFLVLGNFQVVMAAAVWVGPVILGRVLPHLVGDQTVAQSIGRVLPDYLMAGALGACGLILGKGLYVLLDNFRMQVLMSYCALILYIAYFLHLGKSLTVDKVALGAVLFNGVGIIPVAIYLSRRHRWAGFGFYAFGSALLLAVWLLTR